jgi:hypothetical protein
VIVQNTDGPQEADVSDINTPQDPDEAREGDRDTPADEMSSYNIAPPADDEAPAVPDEEAAADE